MILPRLPQLPPARWCQNHPTTRATARYWTSRSGSVGLIDLRGPYAVCPACSSAVQAEMMTDRIRIDGTYPTAHYPMEPTR